LTLKPEPEDAEKIKKKLQRGLPGPLQARQVKPGEAPKQAAKAKKSTEAKTAPSIFGQ
jgi:hypothetical protein